MKETTVKFLVSQLGYQAPSLLVYLVAVVLAIIFMRRAFVPSLLTILGVSLLALASFSRVGLNVYLIESIDPQAAWVSVIQLMMLFVSAAGLASLVAAVFVGRRNELAVGGS